MCSRRVENSYYFTSTHSGINIPVEGGMYRDFLTDEEASNIRPRNEGLGVEAKTAEELAGSYCTPEAIDQGYKLA
jgi:hypothetical protein